jgi:hypothetical protein
VHHQDGDQRQRQVADLRAELADCLADPQPPERPVRPQADAAPALPGAALPGAALPGRSGIVLLRIGSAGIGHPVMLATGPRFVERLSRAGSAFPGWR